MLRENQYILRQVNIALDVLVTLAALVIAYFFRQGLNMYLLPNALAVMRLQAHLWLLPVAPLVIVAALAWNGLYHDESLRIATRDLIRRIAASCIESTVILMALVLLLGKARRASALTPGTELAANIGETSTAFLVLLAVFQFALLVAKTGALRWTLIALRRRGRFFRRVLLVGSGEPLERFAHTILNHPLWGLQIAGVVTDLNQGQSPIIPPSTGGKPDLPILADLEHAPALLARAGVDEVVFVPDAAPLSRLRPLMEACEEMGLRTHLPLNFYEGPIARPVLGQFDEIPVLSYWPTRLMGPALLFKYAFDRLAAPLLLALCSPLMLAAALAIRLTSRPDEPILFGQIRCGLNGRLFTCWKFRSMTADAEARRAALDPLNEQSGPVFKLSNDPRVTPVGRLLRKFSIDELPQLWNVARGEMALVGPRPPLPEEVERYDRWQRRRLSMKPGITCLWQVRGRNKLPFDTWMKLDLEYIDQWSLWLDFKILLRTLWVVITGYGAM